MAVDYLIKNATIVDGSGSAPYVGQVAIEGDRIASVMGAAASNGDQPDAPPSDDANPAWSPRGTKILFSRERGNDRNVWVMSADGSDLQQLTLSRSTEDEPAWLGSPRSAR